MGRSSVFSLEQIYRKQLTQTWSKIPEVFRYVNSLATPGGTPFGYIGGGSPGPSGSTKVDRIDYDNDTATSSPKGNLNTARSHPGSTGNSSYGYWGGGTGPLSSVDRIDYSSDTDTASPKGNLSLAKRWLSATGNSSYGYYNGGNTGSDVSSVDRIDFSSDTSTAAAKGPLSSAKRWVMSTGNQSYGYVGGGEPPSVTTMNRIDYASDTGTTPTKGELTQARYGGAATGNADFGYFGGGFPAPTSRIDRLDFSNDTATAVTKGPLTSARKYLAATGSSSFGYFVGGQQPGTYSYIDRVDYSNDTPTSSPKGPLSRQDSRLSAASPLANALPAPQGIVPATRSETYPAGGPNYGYIAGGDPTSDGGTHIYRIDFDSDTTTAAPKGNLYVSRKSNSEGAVGNGSYGYFAGGWSPGHLSSIDRMDYGNDTATATPKGNLANPGNNWAAAGNTNYGWITAGESPSTGYMTSINRMDYSSDTGTTVRGNTDNYTRIGTAGNLSYGYWAGGQNPKTSRTVRLDYSNDTVWGTTKGSLNASKYNVEGAGNANYGYFAGGSTGVPSTDPSVVDRLDYSNDTATASPKGNLSGKMSDDAATANGSYGYFAPGPSGQPNKRSIDRVDFSNDTATASPRGNILNDADGRMGISPLENGLPSPTTKTVDKGADGYQTTSEGPAFGYHGAGYPGPVSTISKIDYSNDTATATTAGPLDSAKYGLAAIANVSYAYWVAGMPGGSYGGSTIQRLDLSSDSTAASVKGPLSRSTYKLGSAVGTNSYGYICGGEQPSGTASTVDRIDYADDTATSVVKGALSFFTLRGGAAGNQSYGWVGAGLNDEITNICRIDYSNDTATAVAKGPLSAGAQYIAATGNANYGYWGGGAPRYTLMDRIDYSNDTGTATPKGALYSGRQRHGATGDTSYGYFTSGIDPGPGTGATTKVDRVDFSNDTATASPKGDVAQKSHQGAAASGKANAVAGSPTFIPRIRWVDSVAETPAGTAAPGYAYWGGGGPAPAGKTIVDRLDFSNDSAAMAPKGSLSQSRKQLTAVGSPSYVYMMGGYNADASPGYELSYIDRIDYASDTSTATPKGLLAEGAYQAGATGTASYGYHGAGRASSGVISCTVQRIDYSNDTATASPKGYLTIRRRNFAGCVGNTSYGYWSGGENNLSTWISTTERVDFSNDTAAATVKGPVDGPVRGNADGTGNANYGYYAGGYYPDSPAPAHRYSIVSRIDFSSDTGTIPTKAALSDSLSAMGAAGNASYGYWGAGADPSGLKTSVDRVDFSNDTSTPTVVTAYLSDSRAQAGAASGLMYGLPQTASAAIAAPVQPPFPYPVQLHNNKNYGYFAAGYSTSPSSMVLSQTQRIDYTNDTSTAVLKGNLTIPATTGGDKQSGTGSPNYGYIAGGNPASTNADRIDYANDTATALLKSNVLTVAASRLAAVGNASYGYFAGGHTGGTIISRLDYSNDDGGGASKGNLTITGTGKTGVGNQSYGYVSGGIFKTTVDRIDYSSDTSTAAVKGPLAAQGYARGATGNGSYGYIAGGSPETVSGTNIQRIDYANDTNTALLKGTISESKFYLCGTGDQSYGYFGGGRENTDPAYPDITSTSKIERIDFSNDTATASPKGPLAIAFREGAAVSAAANANT